eukprot:CAMPEP_0181327302 /NCGR_PEP_ID=MMETSP1101-20121128/22025_1 /TAXON_ID=46948 /ORGANISM="Rhodomonas abbreviata, Strain Caron Lab Isolate" /LENGTH=68 /DNA_ID=CAMNT_0023435945 /DNA_START=70 /DNA_END=276 /DNA_ORIENTATION=-
MDELTWFPTLPVLSQRFNPASEVTSVATSRLGCLLHLFRSPSRQILTSGPRVRPASIYLNKMELHWRK